ncbi:hsp72-like protein [Histomonas meleagridis]|uniref:hsp72-like protein n=1 Tax=Histomonas meleagridis TaxID=135588 RepID=UPI00355A230C|nr:hsp72-like protein [Histomonas meleagridis]KAH0806117.1 hsp72-like protein [Histomonas meleagridis]
MKAKNPKPFVGIDFGTTYSSVCLWRNNNIELIANNNSNYSTPSIVTIQEEGEPLIGEPAKEAAVFNPTSTIYDSKRMIGRKFDSKEIQEDIKHWPFKVVNHENTPMIEVKFGEKIEKYSPIQISSYILGHMKGIVDNYLSLNTNDPIDAVITAPAYYDAVQRAAIMEAAKMANIHVLRIIDEPTAAAIAYGLKNEPYEISKKILVFDFGGGTLDLSLLEVQKYNFKVIDIGGDMHLGGQDFDNNLVEYFVQKFNSKYKCDLHKDKRAMSLLKNACEDVKTRLSKVPSTKISIPSLYNSIDYNDKITRATFEDINFDLFERMMIPVKKLLKHNKVKKGDIDNVILVGGSSRIPKVRKILSDYFGEELISKNIDPDKAVVQGAAIDAANEEKEGEFPIVTYTSVVSHPIGIETNGTDMDIIIARGEQIPYKSKPKYYSPANKYVPVVDIKVFVGENPKTCDNVFLGKFRLSGIKIPDNGQIPKIQVVLEVDQNGILSVTAEDMCGGASEGIQIHVEKILDL